MPAVSNRQQLDGRVARPRGVCEDAAPRPAQAPAYLSWTEILSVDDSTARAARLLSAIRDRRPRQIALQPFVSPPSGFPLSPSCFEGSNTLSEPTSEARAGSFRVRIFHDQRRRQRSDRPTHAFLRGSESKNANTKRRSAPRAGRSASCSARATSDAFLFVRRAPWARPGVDRGAAGRYRGLLDQPGEDDNAQSSRGSPASTGPVRWTARRLAGWRAGARPPCGVPQERTLRYFTVLDIVLFRYAISVRSRRRAADLASRGKPSRQPERRSRTRPFATLSGGEQHAS